ncbi:zona pellucida sperm-binding protein 3-like [Synchiropus splendidus]|uniref:zona pellucida sperm-binding protein 3-like n=1 Tax=Synchiropus splendidus TaxID=270530 RepID=UPI00237D587B|nr:zona pellucida sperm-binding protein 3-like [Synchiropus splendidus]
MKALRCIYFTLSVLALYQWGCSARTFDSAVRHRKPTKAVLAEAQAHDAPTRQLRRPQHHGRNISGENAQTAAHRALDVPAHTYLPDVSVTCAASDFVVRVKPAFYGLEADASELRLGGSCRSNGVLAAHGDMLFTYPLTACDSTRVLTPAYLIYKFRLHYVPSPMRFPLRTHPIQVEIECHYQRDHHVHQLTVQPTWETTVLRKGLNGSPNDFKMELMDEFWSDTPQSQVYQPGETVHIQVSAPQMPPGGKLYIKNCYAAPSTGPQSSKIYTIIDNFGCLLDSKKDLGASRFVSRTDDALRFSLKAFQFISSPDTEVSIHCNLFATTEEPGPSHKSCSYVSDRWTALRGDDSICQCCDSHCVAFKSSTDIMEGLASSELLVSDQPLSEHQGIDWEEPPSPRFWREIVNKLADEDYSDMEEVDMESPALWEGTDPEEGSGSQEGSKPYPSWNKSQNRGGMKAYEEQRKTGGGPEQTWYFPWT